LQPLLNVKSSLVFLEFDFDVLVADVHGIRFVVTDRNYVQTHIVANWAGDESLRTLKQRRCPKAVVADYKIAVLFARQLSKCVASAIRTVPTFIKNKLKYLKNLYE
jgi:hypothetical protein